MSPTRGSPEAGVAAYLSDLENDPRWRREWVDARMKAVYEVALHEPHRFTEWRTVSGPLPLTFRRAFEAVEGGTQVTFTYDAHPNVVLRLLEPLVIRMGKRQLDGDLPKLRAILET